MEAEIELFIDRYLNEIVEDNAAIFAGAGLSMPVGYVDWRSLIKPLADELGIDINKEKDLVGLAQYYVNENGRHRLNQEIVDQLGSNVEPTENHKILSRLPIKTYWTTNYDNLIEQSLKAAGKVPDVKFTVNQLAITRKGRNAIVYKMHGDAEHPDSAVVTKDDYERYFIEKGPYINALSGDLVSKTFLFVGFGLSDPNLDYVLSRIRVTFKEHQRQHYCIFKKVQETDYSDNDVYSHAVLMQNFMIKDLQRFNIKTLLVSDYTEITHLLTCIENKYKAKTVFLSGSVHDFSPWDKNSVENFIYSLGEILIDKGYKVASGLGLGIGNAFISGAIKRIYDTPELRVEDYLVLRPFPQYIKDKDQRRITWQNYRKDILTRSGIAIFFMGNKVDDDGNTALANGVEEEFCIAEENNLLVLPIGGSDWMAKELWNRVVSNWENYYPEKSTYFRDKIQELGEHVDDPKDYLSVIVELLDLL